MPAFTSIKVYAELNEVWTDITQYIKGKNVNGHWGIKGGEITDILADVGSLSFTLKNDTGQFYPDGDSPLSGWGAGIRIKIEFVYGGNTKKFLAYLDKDGLKFNVAKRETGSTVNVTALDWMKFVRNAPIKAPSIELDKRADEGIDTLLTLVSPAPQNTNIDTGVFAFPSIFGDAGINSKVYSELYNLIVSEFGHCYVEKDATYGETLRFENLTSRNSGTPATTLENDIDSVEPDYGGNVINRVKAVAYPRDTSSEIQTLYSLGRAAPIRAGETLPDFRGRYTDPTGGGRQTHAVVSTMKTPVAPGATDPYMMALLNFTGSVWDETGRHTWNAHDCGIVNNIYYDIVGTRIPGAILGDYTVFGGYSDYRITTTSSEDFDPGSGAFSIVWCENRLNTTAGKATLSRDATYTFPYLLGYSNGTNLYAYFSSNNTSWDIPALDMGPISQSRWTWYEVSRDADGWFYTFQDGKLITKLHSSLAIAAGQGGDFTIGYAGGAWGWFGFDSFYFKKGECLHTSDFDIPRRQETPTLDGDYLMNTADDGTGTDLSDYLTIVATYDSAGVTYSLTNTSSFDAYIIHLQARGLGVYAYDSIDTAVEDTDSIAAYDTQELTIDQPYQQDLIAGRSIATSVVGYEADPRTKIKSVSFTANRSAATMNDFILRDVGDLVRIIYDPMGVDNYYHIQSVDFKVVDGKNVYVKWGVKSAYAIDAAFGGAGWGGEGDHDGVISVGDLLTGLNTGVEVTVEVTEVGITQENNVTVDDIETTVEVTEVEEITVDTITVYDIETTVEIDTVGIPDYVAQHSILSPQHGDTTEATVQLYDLLVGQGSPATWQRFAVNATATRKFLMSVSSTVSYDTLQAGDIPDMSGTYVTKSLFDANTILYATSDNTPLALTLAANTFPARSSSGAIAAKAITDFILTLLDDSTAADARTTLGVVAATTSTAGIVELATTAETTTGTDATRAVTPDGLHDMTSLAGAAWFLDEDAMTSNSATKTASQQSIKAYFDDNALAAPKYSQMFGNQFTKAAGAGSKTYVISYNYMFNFGVYITPANDADEFEGGAYLRSGVTYAFWILHGTNTDRGKVDGYVGATKVGTIDMYSASPTYVNETSFGTTSVASDGYYKVRLVINGKNASSSGYAAVYTSLWLVPSSY